tara:strand:+ start:4713 stop:5831 length:1119 start_codon:yes stop_codon:yes gene_type:complete
MPVYTHFPISNVEGQDRIKFTEKITAGYFPGSAGQLNNDKIYTSSLASSNAPYYFSITNDHTLSSSAEAVASVAFGHFAGSGSLIQTDTKSESQVVYRQWAQRLLTSSEITGGFYISSTTSREDYIYVLVGKRERFKDRVNPKNWVIALSGSNSAGSGSYVLYLTDDSDVAANETTTPAGPRYNIVSASSTTGTVYTAASTRTLGWFYPDAGTWVFSGTELSSSIPGTSGSSALQTQFLQNLLPADQEAVSQSRGFHPSARVDEDQQNALRFVNCLRGPGGFLKLRSEEDQTSVSYFCRLRAGDANFSNNPTFVSGSENKLRHSEMFGNPQTFISAVGLEDQNENLVAVAKLSKPLRKNFASEATIKVKLTY